MNSGELCLKGKLRTFCIWFLCTALLFTTAFYQLPWIWHYGTDVKYLNDMSSICNIPLFDPYSNTAKILIEESGRLESHATCIDTPVKFKINYINSSIVRKDTNSTFWKIVLCCYTVFWREGSKIINGDECFPITEEYTHVPYDHTNLDLKCYEKESQKIVYRDLLPIFRPNYEIETKLDEISSKTSSNPLSVLILGLDSVSHANFVRYMPKSYHFLMDNLSAFEFFGFNKIGRGTLDNVMAMLTGCKILNPSKPPYHVDDHCELIWEHFIKKGYRTLHFEDSSFNEFDVYPIIRKTRPGIGTHYNISDFMKFLRKVDKEEFGDKFNKGMGCYDNQFVMDVFAESILQVATTYSNKSYFNFVWFGKTGHDVMLNTKYMDDPIYRIIFKLNEETLLESTILVIVSDHGPWRTKYVDTEAGAIERLMPTLYIVFPKWFKKKYPHALQNMKLNTERLTTQYDLHKTLMDLLDLDQLTNTILKLKEVKEDKNQLGKSLFRQISSDRSCETANIPSEFCICLQRETVSTPKSNLNVQTAAAYGVNHINSEVQQFPMCSAVELKSIVIANRLKDTQNSKYPDSEFLEVRFITSPGDAEFQITVNIKPVIQIIGQLLRTNLYKGQSDCVSSWKNATYVKTMCYCTNP